MARDLLLIALFGALSWAVAAFFAADPEVLRHLRASVRRGGAPQPAEEDAAGRERSSLRTRLVAAIERMLARRSLSAGLSIRLRAADLNLRPGEFLLISLGIGVLGTLLGVIFSALAALMLGLGGLLAPSIVLVTRSQERQKQIAAALPDTLGTISNALRAGFSLMQALDACARQTHGALGQEFERMLAETRVGVPIDEALENLARRARSADLELMVTVVGIQRQVGGNLAEILDRIQQTIRERVRLQGEVRALSAQGRISAMVVGAMPLALVAVMSVMSPTFLDPMWQPGPGRALLIFAVFLQVIGFLALRRIVRIEV
ncbi:MAG: type II secretion system F family protein [Thermaerobacter sp.]|nr:type II secretion system F family protein [Thermaerobacter sp.]